MSVQSRWNHHRRGSTPSATSPSSAAIRSGPGIAWSPRVRRHDAAASRTEMGSESVGSGTADHLTPSSSTNREPVDASSACARLAISTTRSRARPSDHPEQATLVLQPGAVAVRLRHEPIQGLEVEHRLRQREAGEVPFDGADHDHGVELAARGSVGREDLDGVRLATFPRREPGTALPGVHRRQERLDRRVGGGAGLRDGARERHDRVELAPRLDGGVGRVDQAARAGQLAPQDRERVEHRAVGRFRRPPEDPAHLLHVRGLLRGEAVRELEGTPHGSGPGVRDPQEAARRRGRQADEVRRQDRFDQPVPLVLGRDEPTQREDERPRGRLLRERDAALGGGPRHPRIVEGPQEAAHVRSLPADDDGELPPARRRLRRGAAAAHGRRPRTPPRCAPRSTRRRAPTRVRGVASSARRATAPANTCVNRSDGHGRRALEREDVRLRDPPRRRGRPFAATGRAPPARTWRRDSRRRADGRGAAHPTRLPPSRLGRSAPRSRRRRSASSTSRYPR